MAVHRKLTAFFVALGVDPDVAAKDACKVEGQKKSYILSYID
mgnify:CR=1 FL=1